VASASSEALLTPASAYDLAAPYYDAWKWQAFWRGAELPTLIRTVDQWAAIRGKPRLADIGCGTGWYLGELQARCASVVGLDISPAMLAQARARLPNVELLHADIRDLPLRDGSFDIVLSTRVLSHLADVALAVSELARVVSKGGLVVLTNVDSEHDYEETRLPIGGGHIQARTFKHARSTIQALLESHGLAHVRSQLVTEGGAIPLEALAGASALAAIGWITVWRREDG